MEDHYYPDPDSAYEDQFHSEDAEYYDTEEVYGDEYDDDMDGDHDSAMASAGWGTDEDYGYYGENY